MIANCVYILSEWILKQIFFSLKQFLTLPKSMIETDKIFKVTRISNGKKTVDENKSSNRIHFDKLIKWRFFSFYIKYLNIINIWIKFRTNYIRWNKHWNHNIIS